MSGNKIKDDTHSTKVTVRVVDSTTKEVTGPGEIEGDFDKISDFYNRYIANVLEEGHGVKPTVAENGLLITRITNGTEVQIIPHQVH